MKKRVARRRAAYRWLEREAKRRPTAMTCPAVERALLRESNRWYANDRNRKKRQMNELNKRVRRICEILDRRTTPEFVTVGERGQAAAEQLQRFKEKYHEFQNDYKLVD